VNTAYGRYGVYGGDPATAIALAVGATAQTVGLGIQAQRAQPKTVELQMAAYQRAAERKNPVLQARMQRTLLGIAALTIGGGLALVAIIAAGKTGKKQEKPK
jgi:hypothetical protein